MDNAIIDGFDDERGDDDADDDAFSNPLAKKTTPTAAEARALEIEQRQAAANDLSTLMKDPRASRTSSGSDSV
eukprot:SAG22_NODE_2779_length_2216_cov_1.666037_2_plen_73_part_00